MDNVQVMTAAIVEDEVLSTLVEVERLRQADALRNKGCYVLFSPAI